jgi:RNA-directed DNA polymerase
MGREFHVRFCEGLGVQFPRATRLIITGTSKVLLEYEVKPLVAQFLSERGLELSHEKTIITHIDHGFDFLGQTVRRYRDGKVLLKPSRRSVKTFFTKIQQTIDGTGSLTAGQLIQRLNQQIKGWTMYHRHASSKRIFTQIDRRLFRLVWHWCQRRHDTKSRTWVKQTYFQSRGNRHWVFTGTLYIKGRGYSIQLMEAAKVSIRDWVKVRSAVNPYDPEWELYLEERECWKLQQTLAGREQIVYLWKEQEGRCRVCRQRLRLEEAAWWHIHHRRWRCHGGADTADNQELLHANCHRQLHACASKTAKSRVSPEALVKT